MKKLFFFFYLLASFSGFAQQDYESCKDSPMFPKRMTNYFITECAKNFNESELIIDENGTTIRKEGMMTVIRYDFNTEANLQQPSTLQILKNFENAVKNIDGITVYQSATDAVGTYKLMKNGAESVWIKVECLGGNNSEVYRLTIIELEAMSQEVASTEILTALNTVGRIALYINFETGKSVVKPESEKAVNEIVELLNANPALKIAIEGHTDNVGNQATNQILSEARAKSIMDSLVAKGIEKSRLNSKGFGQTKPVADNATEEGKAKNRRVEIVKL